MIKAAIFGATGYTGVELVRLVCAHPDFELVYATSRSAAGQSLRRLYPTAPALMLIDAADVDWGQVDVAFLCLPHAAAATTAVAALQAGVRVVDLSADFRLRDAAVYAKWYGQPHVAPQLLGEAVYGLTEFAREELADARLVANPGCYPTSILLGVAPLLASGAVGGTIIADSKSGVSGAGRAPKQGTHFVEVADNFAPYKIGRSHRHLPEIEQGMRRFHADAPDLIFSPHLLPVPRGIVSTIYVPTRMAIADVRRLYQARYGDEPFVDLLPEGELATLAHVVRTNRCVISLTAAGDHVVIVSAEDNLIKGAAGQALQNANVMFGLAETAGLLAM